MTEPVNWQGDLLGGNWVTVMWRLHPLPHYTDPAVINCFNASPKAMTTWTTDGNIWNQESKLILLFFSKLIILVFCHWIVGGLWDRSFSLPLSTFPHTRVLLGKQGRCLQRETTPTVQSCPAFSAIGYIAHILPMCSLPHTSLALSWHSDPDHSKAKATFFFF